VDSVDVAAPSVITLNALSAAQAANDLVSWPRSSLHTP
jgi:hypothetical protein